MASRIQYDSKAEMDSKITRCGRYKAEREKHIAFLKGDYGFNNSAESFGLEYAILEA
jgi:hypothetical protein